MSFRIYVEGGGDGRNRGGKSIDIECKRAFTRFFERAGLEGRCPAVIACGSRQRTYDSFITALKPDAIAAEHRPLLLVDAEGPVAGDDPWKHLTEREGDGWLRPVAALPMHAHLMVQQMESWFLADRQLLARHFGRGFVAHHLPGDPRDVESIPRARVMDGLKAAARQSRRGGYSKGRDSFELLGELDPALVEAASPWARRLLQHLRAGPT